MRTRSIWCSQARPNMSCSRPACRTCSPWSSGSAPTISRRSSSGRRPIRQLSDLKGKKISFGEIGSTSQHLGPAQILGDAGLAYGRDYEALFPAPQRRRRALRRGDLAAIGMNLTHIQQIRRAVPDVKLAVIGRGRDLPDDLIIAAPSVSTEMVAQIRKAFIDHAKPLLDAILQVEANQRWAGGTSCRTCRTAIMTASGRCTGRSASTSSPSSSASDDRRHHRPAAERIRRSSRCCGRSVTRGDRGRRARPRQALQDRRACH